MCFCISVYFICDIFAKSTSCSQCIYLILIICVLVFRSCSGKSCVIYLPLNYSRVLCSSIWLINWLLSDFYAADRRFSNMALKIVLSIVFETGRFFIAKVTFRTGWPLGSRIGCARQILRCRLRYLEREMCLCPLFSVIPDSCVGVVSVDIGRLNDNSCAHPSSWNTDVSFETSWLRFDTFNLLAMAHWFDFHTICNRFRPKMFVSVTSLCILEVPTW